MGVVVEGVVAGSDGGGCEGVLVGSEGCVGGGCERVEDLSLPLCDRDDSSARMGSVGSPPYCNHGNYTILVHVLTFVVRETHHLPTT